MEREFQSMYVAGDGSAGSEYSLQFKPEGSYYRAFSNLAFQSSMASLNQEKALLSSLDYPCTSSSSLPETLSYGNFQANFDGNQVVDTDQKLESIDFMEAEPPQEKRKLKMPKYEYPPPEPYNFIVPRSSVPAPEYALYPDSCFNQLPDLRSLEYVQNYDLAVSEPSSSRKRGKSPPPSSSAAAALTTDPYVLQAIFRNFEYASYSATVPENPQPTSKYHRANDVARIRRNALSEKTRCLQKLLPWDRKMDTATMYEEAHKYIKFLQAQVSVLQSMPRETGAGFSTRSNPSVDIDLYGGLGRLKRQQLLQVLVNSPAAQTVLCSKGFCVYSSEQLVALKKLETAKVLSNLSMIH